MQKSKITRNFQEANQETSKGMMKKRRMHTSSSLTIPLNEGNVDAHFGKGPNSKKKPKNMGRKELVN